MHLRMLGPYNRPDDLFHIAEKIGYILYPDFREIGTFLYKHWRAKGDIVRAKATLNRMNHSR